MIEKIIVIPDSFKNTMDSRTVSNIIKDVISENIPDMKVLVYPIADGGEGTALIFSEYLNLNIQKMKTTNAYNKEIEIEYGSNGVVGVIDIASVVGFDANEGEVLNPSVATTYGIGLVLSELIKMGHKKIYVGLGGSITNDLGMGMLAGLGVIFKDSNCQTFIPTGATLREVEKINSDVLKELKCKIICLSDVKSPLFGPTGAARMFARQKGADDLMIEKLEEDGQKIVKVIGEYYNDYSSFPGSGAAGGLGYAFKTFLNAEMVSGIDEILDISKVKMELNEKALIITGEGKFDRQSIEGKVISGIVKMAEKSKSRVIIIAGCVEEDNASCGIEKVFACSELGRDFEEVKKTCKEDLKKTSLEVCKYILKKKSL